jgi:anti-anti-sigma factor
MEILTREVGEVRVLDIIGKLDSNTTPEAEVQVGSLLDSGASKLLINFDKLDYISSAGLRLLLVTAKRMRKDAADLRICGLNATVQEVFDISGFASILNVFSTESEALNDFD